MNDVIKFTCPVCKRSHERGYFNATLDTFRCMGCGYIGHGFHADPEVDDRIHSELREARKIMDLGRKWVMADLSADRCAEKSDDDDDVAYHEHAAAEDALEDLREALRAHFKVA